MKWLVDNWSLLVVVVCALVGAAVYVKKFYDKPTEEQIAKVKEWLLFAVIMAEKDLGEGTGALKLRYVYDAFVERFPAIAQAVSFEVFSFWVDEVLDEMRDLLKSNGDIENYVEKGAN